MTSDLPRRPGLPRLASRTPGLLAVVAASLVPLLAACAGAAAQVHLPAKEAAAKAAAVSAPRPATQRQQVIAAYTGYTTAMAAAFSSRSPARVSRLLRPYLDAATIRNAARAFSHAWAAGEVTYGQVEQHIISVRVQGRAAWVHDCDNTSGSGLAYASTGQVVPGSLGIPDENIVTRLNLVHGHWVVWVQTVEDLPCKP
jgi:hypothetical protein